MKKGYFELTLLLLMAGYGLFAWADRSREQAEAATKANELHRYLQQRLDARESDLQALSLASDIEHLLDYGLGTFFVVLYVVLLIGNLHLFTRAKLASDLAQAFVRIWTWRP